MRFLRSRYGVLLPGITIAALTCAQSAGGPTSPLLTSPAPETTAPSHQPTAKSGISPERLPKTPTEPPPKVDKSRAGVPLEDIIFDTFDGGFARLSEAEDELIDRLLDAIKPIYEPKYVAPNSAEWLTDDDLVLTYVSARGNAFAYPVRILNFHEIVNDVIDGVPVLISYCPLCASGMVYGRELEGQTLLFGNTSALFESNVVMFDHRTGSYWFQVLGEGIVGPLTGKRLTLLPSMTTTWGEWKKLHPDTQVLSRELGLLPRRTYDRDPFAGFADRVNQGEFAFPVSLEKLDDRLLPGERVLAIQVGEIGKAYQISNRLADEAINDEVGGVKVLVIVRAVAKSGAAYFRSLDGRTFTFRLNQDAVEDAETGSRWDDAGRAVSGPMAGAQLTPAPMRTSFWFSVVGAFPGMELHRP